MRIDREKFKKNTCAMCKQFTGDKPVVGKCMASYDKMLVCAKMRLVNTSEYVRITGIEE